MNLNAEEYEIIHQRMQTFKITYQEIYAELLDHIYTDIETRRAGGDLRKVQVIFDELISNSLGGPDGIAKMAREHEKLYRLKIHRRIWKTYGRHIWLKTLIAVACSAVIDQFIPDTVNYTVGIYGLILLTMLVLEAMVIVRMRSIKSAGIKQSLLKTSMVWHIFMPGNLLNIALMVPNLINTLTHYQARAFMKVHPIIPIVIFCYVLLYTESCFQVMEEEMRAAKAT